jgi:hypothetical protein
MRSGGNNENNFNYNSKPYDIKSEKHFDNFVEIKTLLHPVTLMNELINKLLVKYSNKCKIVINENKLKFFISLFINVTGCKFVLIIIKLSKFFPFLISYGFEL